MIILALAILVGSGLGALVAFVVDFLDRRVKSPRQAEEITNLPTLAAIPLVGTRELAHRANRGREALAEYDPKTTAMLPAVMQPPLMRYALDEPTSFFAEAVRAVRLAIQRSSRNDPVRTVMVSSSIDGERTVLVDGDLRNPELTRSLCPQAKHGLVEVAAGHVPLQQALVYDGPTGLAFLPTPPRRKGGFINEFVFSESMSNLLEHLRGQFDFVVIDSPPLVPLVDARALAELSDRIVLAIRWDATPQEVVGQALETLAPCHDRVLGTVLTRVDLRRLRFYDYYRSSSYIQAYSYLGQPRAELVP
jgi:Mrp family chromosome partitioning ATPase